MVIMGFQHVDYETSLNELHLPTLKTRRDQLYLTFAKRAILNDKVRSMFPLRKEFRDQRKRHTERFLVQKNFGPKNSVLKIFKIFLVLIYKLHLKHLGIKSIPNIDKNGRISPPLT